MREGINEHFEGTWKYLLRERKGEDPSYAFVTFLLKGIMPEWMKLQFIVLQQLYFQLCLKQASISS